MGSPAQDPPVAEPPRDAVDVHPLEEELRIPATDAGEVAEARERDLADGAALRPHEVLRDLVGACRDDVPVAQAHDGSLAFEKARQLGVDVNEVFSTLQGYLGSTYVNQFNKFGRTFQVYVQADHPYRLRPGDLNNYYVRNSSGGMVPLGTLADIRYEAGPALIDLYNLRPTAAIIGMPSLESQAYASPASKAGHVNCKSMPELRELMLRYFHNVFMFSMNDEVVHTGHHKMAHYLWAVGAGVRR